MKRLIVLALSAGVLAFAATAAVGAGQPPVSATRVALAHLQQSYSINVRKPADLIVVTVEVPTGASFGWHSHPSSVAVAITSGTLTLYDGDDPTCTPRRLARGHGFVEPPNHVYFARNEGTTPVTLYATYLGLPHGVNPNLPAQGPYSAWPKAPITLACQQVEGRPR
jgi:quercetin dioxygenase-like cupin family protein